MIGRRRIASACCGLMLIAIGLTGPHIAAAGQPVVGSALQCTNDCLGGGAWRAAA